MRVFSLSLTQKYGLPGRFDLITVCRNHTKTGGVAPLWLPLEPARLPGGGGRKKIQKTKFVGMSFTEGNNKDP